jgi:hypothetical protein
MDHPGEVKLAGKAALRNADPGNGGGCFLQALEVNVKDNPIEVVSEGVFVFSSWTEEQGAILVYVQLLMLAFILDSAAEDQVDGADSLAGADRSLDRRGVAARDKQIACLAGAGAVHKVGFMALAGAEIQQGIVLGQALGQILGISIQLGQMVVEGQPG